VENVAAIEREGFDYRKQAGFGSVFGSGNYFALTKDVAEKYESVYDLKGISTQRVEARINLHNPLLLDLSSISHHPDLRQELLQQIPNGKEAYDAIFREMLTNRRHSIEARKIPNEAIRRTIQKAGYDGIIITDPNGIAGGSQAIAFERSQIVVVTHGTQ
jgi:hypothetical protein